MCRAIHISTYTIVAIKVLNTISLRIPYHQFLINSEISTLKDLSRESHQNVCNLHETIQCEHHVFIIMEHCQGDTLSKWIKFHRGLPEHKAREILRQILEGVAHIHSQGYVHRDLKPLNIMCNDSQDVKIIDFGFAVKVDSIPSSARKDNNGGTPVYHAPEIFKGTVLNAQKVDIWALGVTFYVMLCAKPPFSCQLPLNDVDVAELGRKVMTGQYKNLDDISQPTSALLRSMLTLDPQRRPTAQELLDTYYPKQCPKQSEKHPRKQGSLTD